MHRSEIKNRVAGMCGISVHVLRKILSESKKLCENETFTTPAVSYTHLDVYKRQVYTFLNYILLILGYKPVIIIDIYKFYSFLLTQNK